MTAREDLLTLLRDEAIVRGRVTLSSGLEADYYVDLRCITLSGQAAPLGRRGLLGLTADLEFDVVGRLTMGADPVATAMLHVAAARGRRLEAFVMRKEAKAHGLQRRAQEARHRAPPCARRRGHLTTGGSPLTALAAVREAGATPVGVAVIPTATPVRQPRSGPRPCRTATPTRSTTSPAAAGVRHFHAGWSHTLALSHAAVVSETACAGEADSAHSGRACGRIGRRDFEDDQQPLVRHAESLHQRGLPPPHRWRYAPRGKPLGQNPEPSCCVS